MNDIVIRGLTQNNLHELSLTIPKRRIVVFTGVSGSGKSSIVFDTIAAEAARQMNETYPAFVRNRMPKHEKPQAELICNLSPAVIVDRTALTATCAPPPAPLARQYPFSPPKPIGSAKRLKICPHSCGKVHERSYSESNLRRIHIVPLFLL